MRHRIVAGEPVTKKITVTWNGKTVEVDEKEAKLYYDHEKGPHEVTWELVKTSISAQEYRLKIAWEYDAPFSLVANPKGEKGKVDGTGNTRRRGNYGYSVLLVDENDQVVAGVDPRILNDPFPPRISS